MTLPKAIICDIDGTLADHRHRLHFVQRKNVRYERNGDALTRLDDSGPDWQPNWEAFYAAMDQDSINEGVNILLKTLDVTYRTLFITGRPEKYREKTIQWLRQKLWSIRWELFMRPDFLDKEPCDYCSQSICTCMDEEPDHRPAHVVKKEIFELEIVGKYDILFALEDRDDCIEMYKGLGITCLKVCLP